MAFSVGDKLGAGDMNKRPAAASGTVAITPSAANTATSASVTFPAGRFATAPAVTAVQAGGSTAVTGVGVTNVTTTGCLVWLWATNTTARNVYWTAVEST